MGFWGEEIISLCLRKRVSSQRARAMSIRLFEGAGISKRKGPQALDFEGFGTSMREFGLETSDRELRNVFVEIAKMGGHSPK